ncbi:predicted protein [Streptomyces viridosporus ATCC 14672]|uniref:Predicted protein n=1 Tax=Streptomyces viridosporus (strain ATCC 14672 / DSM 40746 / JCM 4963 / KCTC 9882 / NRRL B-12104 / FH 1290) TaxID=566461 RepID=D5ZQZ7_STRV1|nr:predicted protein [Streptomyces viridosporus ATCC 14672]
MPREKGLYPMIFFFFFLIPVFYLQNKRPITLC